MYANISPSEQQDARPVPSRPALPRGEGEGRLTFAHAHGETRLAERYQQGTAKLRVPRTKAPAAPEAVLINLGGGLTGGDRLSWKIRLEDDASAIVSSQACEKIYRSTGADAQITVNLSLGRRAQLDWLCQPTILFDGGRMTRETRVELPSDAHFLGIEAIIFGRTEMGEAVKTGHVSDRWQIVRDGQLIHAERFAVDGLIDEALARPASLGANRAMASLRYVAPDAEARRDEARAVLEDSPASAAVSAWNSMLLIRFLAPDGHGLTDALTHFLTRFRKAPLPRAWTL